MARGRMINNKIASDAKINSLSDDTSRLAFTWLVTFADVEGRTHGDPAMVRSILFPRRDDISLARMESYIKEWQSLDLIVWYEADGDRWIQFANFDKNQPNLRKNREQPSEIPAPPLPELCRSDAGVTPDQIPVKLSKENIREVKLTDEIDEKPGYLVPLMTTFTSLTGISEFSFNQHDIKALDDMHKAGVTADDERRAIEILQSKEFTISGPSSVQKTAISEMSKRKRGGTSPPPGTVGSTIIVKGPGAAL